LRTKSEVLVDLVLSLNKGDLGGSCSVSNRVGLAEQQLNQLEQAGVQFSQHDGLKPLDGRETQNP
jgi:hypothetical protein